MTRNVESRTMNFPMKKPRKKIRHGSAAAIALLVGLASACSAPAPLDSDVFDEELALCSGSPNCVSSQSTDERHRVEPILLTSGDSATWRAVIARVRESPRTTIVIESDYSLLAEYRSAVFAFVDDLELILREDRTTVDVRSASRLGYWDWGVNRSRVEALRESLRNDGLAR